METDTCRISVRFETLQNQVWDFCQIITLALILYDSSSLKYLIKLFDKIIIIQKLISCVRNWNLK